MVSYEKLGEFISLENCVIEFLERSVVDKYAKDRKNIIEKNTQKLPKRKIMKKVSSNYLFRYNQHIKQRETSLGEEVLDSLKNVKVIRRNAVAGRSIEERDGLRQLLDNFVLEKLVTYE